MKKGTKFTCPYSGDKMTVKSILGKSCKEYPSVHQANKAKDRPIMVVNKEYNGYTLIKDIDRKK